MQNEHLQKALLTPASVSRDNLIANHLPAEDAHRGHSFWNACNGNRVSQFVHNGREHCQAGDTLHERMSPANS